MFSQYKYNNQGFQTKISLRKAEAPTKTGQLHPAARAEGGQALVWRQGPATPIPHLGWSMPPAPQALPSTQLARAACQLAGQPASWLACQLASRLPAWQASLPAGQLASWPPAGCISLSFYFYFTYLYFYLTFTLLVFMGLPLAGQVNAGRKELILLYFYFFFTRIPGHFPK